MNPNTVLDRESLAAIAKREHDVYRAAQPYPHVALDGLFPEELLDRVLAEFPTREQVHWTSYDNVNALAPVMTETELFREMTAEHIASTRAKIPMGRLLTIPEIAAMVAWIVGPECTFCTGFTFDLSGGRATY